MQKKHTHTESQYLIPNLSQQAGLLGLNLSASTSCDALFEVDIDNIIRSKDNLMREIVRLQIITQKQVTLHEKLDDKILVRERKADCCN